MPIFDPLIASLNEYDLELMSYLSYFEDPDNEKEFLNTYYDKDFDEYFNSDEYIEADPRERENFVDEWEEVE